jgi:murein DD-endopeptidase MepM/ murein hydrolase activator NlpD
MNKRKLLIGLLLAGLFTVGLGAGVFPASADQRTFVVTLLGGQTITVSMDVPPGTPLDQIHPPGVSTPVVGVQEVTPAPAPTQPAPPPAPAPTSDEPTGEEPAAAPEQDAAEPVAGPEERERTTGHQRRHPQVEHEGAVGSIVAAGTRTARGARDDEEPLRTSTGAPTPDNPTYSFALPGPAPIGVPNFFIEKFRIPPFLLPIYQAAGIQYGIRWEILAGINEIETDYGRNLNVSSAGAVGWMQFLPSTWKQYGVDANNDGEKDPYNPVDAIFAAARYLRAAGADTDIRKAIFAYNHADWYVDSVLLRARLIGGLPADLIGSLTGLTQGHFPVHAKARYADDLAEAAAQDGAQAGVPDPGDPQRTGINIFAKPGSPVVAVQDGKIVRIGTNDRLGHFIRLRDVYGNTYTYAHLKRVAKAYPVPKERHVSQAQITRELQLPERDPKPTLPASAGEQPQPKAQPSRRVAAAPAPERRSAAPRVRKERLFANPGRPAAFRAGGEDQLLDAGAAIPGTTTFESYFTQVFGLDRKDVVLKRLKVGSRVIAGTILGRIGKVAPHLHFEIRPAGKGAPRVDPKPILDGWKLLETTAIYRAQGKNPFFGPDAKNPTIGQVLLMSKEALERRVLADPNVEIYECGRRDIRAGGVDRRVLATLEFLSASGLKPAVSSLHCGHSFMTTSGNVSEHSSGNAVDIAAINGIPIAGHQGQGSITDITIRRLLTLQGTMRPHQIISLMTFDGADNTLALPDHADHIHVGFRPLFGSNGKLGRQAQAVLKPGQWIKLIDRLGDIQNPTVRVKPSKYAITVEPPHRASAAHAGE